MSSTKKEAQFSGADNLTPSIPQYFSWINSTNEGSTEVQTLINLDYFRYMRDTYGMQIKIYAWDAGNFDGASMGFGDVNSEKFKSQYPEGYKNVVQAAKEIGIRMGLWGSPDGFGNNPETERKRYEFFVHLCRDYHFALFKFDGVCGPLRPEKAQVFADMLIECRKYSPDLIVLNHRLPFYEAEKYITTYLWQSAESYTDACCTPPANTAMHNRSYMFVRGHTENLERLAEDHGVCLSSSMDYFEDELIYQAFSRSLLLAPEIYGNPWLLKDSEQPRLARIFNLHARNAKILVHGKLLGAQFGAHAVSRGSQNKRFICTGNNSWEKKTVKFTCDESLGLTEEGEYIVSLHHPYEEHIATVFYGDTFSVDLMPFRATLIEVARPHVAEPIINGIAYEVIKEDKNGNITEYKVLRNENFDIREKAPVYLGDIETLENIPANIEFLYETAQFAISNDSLEAQSLKRAGKTAVPQIQAARDAFFNQTTYKLRGCSSLAMFDGDEHTFFDAQSRCYWDRNLRIKGGCLRVDLGTIMDIDEIEMITFAPDEPTREVLPLLTPEFAEISTDLDTWHKSSPLQLSELGAYTQAVCRFIVHTIYECQGKKMRFVYKVNAPARYIRIPCPPDRIYSFKVYKNGGEIKIENPFANNMQPHPSQDKTKFVKTGEFTIPQYREGSYIALAVNGRHGVEGVYATLECNGQFFGSDRRSPAYKCNNWETCVLDLDSNNTLFFTLPQGLAGKKAKLYAMFSTSEPDNTLCRAYLCDRHD